MVGQNVQAAAAKLGLDPVPVIDNPVLDERADPDPDLDPEC